MLTKVNTRAWHNAPQRGEPCRSVLNEALVGAMSGKEKLPSLTGGSAALCERDEIIAQLPGRA